jgi:hypothetical protein
MRRKKTWGISNKQEINRVLALGSIEPMNQVLMAQPVNKPIKQASETYASYTGDMASIYKAFIRSEKTYPIYIKHIQLI